MSALSLLRRTIDGKRVAGEGASTKAVARQLTVFLAVVVVVLTLLSSNGAISAPPANFTDVSVVTGLGAPTDIAFLPNGRMLITTQGGTLYSATTAGTKNVAYSVPAICSDFERGLLGVAVDPSFNSNSYVYLFYTFNKNNSCAANSSSSPVNRVSRFTYNSSSNTLSGGSETVLVDNMPSPNGNHNAGDLGFGKDGFLYISIGDGGCDLSNSSLCAGQNTNARKTNILTGKILRVTRDGGIPAGNPFTGSDSGVCAVNGRTTATYCRETYAWGLRNPFRFAFDPNASETKVYVNDVGQGTWEEIDNLVAGADYGWNVREGGCANGSTTNCGAPPSGMTNPIYAYQHGSCNSITSGAFVPNGIWPSQYNGAYLFSDYTCGLTWQLTGSSGSFSRTQFASGAGVISMAFGPSGSTQALYYTTYDGGGLVRKIEYTGQANRPPVARATADKTAGAAPLTVTFDGSDSTDPDGDTLTYDWNFGDGSTHGTGVSPQHTYTTDATRTVTLTVSDGKGGTDTETLTITVGNTQPSATIVSPASGALFNVGQTITLQGTGTDAEDGTIPDEDMTWNVILHHDTHTHPFVTNETGNNVQFTAPAPEDLAAAANSYLEIQLTVTDSEGLSRTVTRNFQPRKVNLTFNTVPAGLMLTVEERTLTGPTTVTSWAGWQIQVEAPSPQTLSGQTYTFGSWSDSGAAAHTITTPSSTQTYTATFQSNGPRTFIAVADSRVREAAASTNYGTSTTLEVDGGSDSDIDTYLRFTVSGMSGPIGKAELWVYVVNGSADGPAVYTSPSGWTETGITWTNRPGRSTHPLDDKGRLSNSQWVVYNVTPVVTGNGTYTFVLATGSSDGITARSREYTTNQPKLVITPDTTDATAPSTPQGVTATAPVYNRVDLKWAASTDNVAVTGYDIYRNGQLLTTVGFQTTYSDTTVTNTTTYEYRVRARDFAGNTSAQSAVARVTTPNRVKTVVAEADARVEARRPTTRYGTSDQLRSQGGASVVESYLRFTVTGVSGTVTKATVRVFVPNSSSYATTNGPAIYSANNSWTESTVTWNTKPAHSTVVRDDKGAIAKGTWVTFDVTPLVAGNGTFSFALVSTSSDYAVFSSREGANPPQLVVEYIPGGAAGVAVVDEIPEATPTREPTATSTPEPTATTAPVEPTATATPSLPITDDFETGDLGAWSNVGGLTVQQEIVANGGFAARASSDGSSENASHPASAVRSIGEPRDEVFAQVGFNLVGLGDNGVTLLTVQSRNDRDLLSVVVTREGDLAIELSRNGDVTELVPVPSGEWHRLQLHVARNGSRSLVEVWFDGTLVFSDTLRPGGSAIEAIRLGDVATDRTFDVVFDDLVIDSTCIGTCSADLVEPTVEAAEPTAEPTRRPRRRDESTRNETTVASEETATATPESEEDDET